MMAVAVLLWGSWSRKAWRTARQIFDPARFHAVGGLVESFHRGFGWHVQQQRQVGAESAAGPVSHLPKLRRGYLSTDALIDDVGQ